MRKHSKNEREADGTNVVDQYDRKQKRHHSMLRLLLEK